MKLDQDRLTTTSQQTSALPLGSYHWRLASISASGEQGPFGPPRTFEIKPLPEKPEASLSSDKEKVVASWQAGAEGQTYQVQVAEDREFKTLLHDETLAEPQLELPQVKGMLRRPASERRGSGYAAGTAEIGEGELAAGRGKVVESLGPAPVPVDEIVRQCQLSPAAVAVILLELELAGRLQRHPGHQVSLAAS